MSRTAAQEWSEFAARVIEPGAPTIQYTEMRLAFYAGMLAAMSGHRPAAPTRAWRRLWDELAAFVRSDIRRLESERGGDRGPG